MFYVNPPAVQFAQGQDVERLRVVVDRIVMEVKNYIMQYEEHREFVEALGTVQIAPENKSALGILELRECRLDTARIREDVPINNLNSFCISNITPSRAQAAAATPTIAPPIVVATTSSVPSTSSGVSDKKIMKRKLPAPRDGWKYSSGKTHRIRYNAMVYHNIVSFFCW